MGITIDTIDYSAHSIKIIDSGGDELAIAADGSITIGAQAFVYAEDSAHTTADEGAFMLAVRSDTKASSAGTDGDYAALIQDADGDLYVSDTVAQGSLSTLAGAISGSEMQVDIVASLPAGTNNIGDVDIASIAAGDNNIGNVDIVTMPGTQTEDAASAGGETLMMIGGYRQDTAGSPVSADGDFQGFIFNSTGELRTSSVLDDVADSSVVVTAVTVDTTVGGVQLVSSALASRRDLTIQNLGAQDFYCKDGTGVTTANGFLIPAKSSATYQWGPNIDLYGITASSTASVRVIEAA